MKEREQNKKRNKKTIEKIFFGKTKQKKSGEFSTEEMIEKT